MPQFISRAIGKKGARRHHLAVGREAEERVRDRGRPAPAARQPVGAAIGRRNRQAVLLFQGGLKRTFLCGANMFQRLPGLLSFETPKP